MTPEELTAFADVESPTRPFPGLRPFEFSESHLYFGRDGQSDQLIRKLAATRFVAVVGTSGSGKSSLVRAGLLPDLFSGFMASAGSHWRVCLMRPSNDPLGNLARALNAASVFGSEIEENAQIQTAITEATLRRGSLGLIEAVRQNRMPSNESLLVVVDQFEELFRFARVSGSEQYRFEAAAFVKLLLEAARQREHAIHVVLTMRSDFLGDCSLFWDLPEAINEGQYLIPRMTRDQRAEAITGPVAVCGGQITQRLVNRLLNDTGDNPDLLPILQHALMRTWEKWAEDHAEGEMVDLRHYEAIGTMSDALSRHADEAWDELPDERSRQIAEKVFKALTEKGEDNREVRRPTELGQLCALTGATSPEVVSVLDAFRREGRSFLMPPASVSLDEESLIDISHESLIRNWQRLKAWVDEEALSAHIYRRLAETAELYERGQAGLWHDPDLQIALNWRETNRPNQVWGARYHPGFETAMKFLDTSVAARDAAVLEAERRRRKELRRARLTAIIFAVAFIFSLAVLTYARIQKNRAEEALTEVESARREAVTQKESALFQAKRAEAESQTATLERNNAESARNEALTQKKFAEEKKVEAEQAKSEAERQAHVAKENQAKAETAKKDAEAQRNLAVAAGEKNRQLLYAADINLAQQAYEANNVRRGQDLLEAHKPEIVNSTPPQILKNSLAGFEYLYLWQLYHGESEKLLFDDVINSVNFSPDGSVLAFASKYNVQFWKRDSDRGRNPASVRVEKGELKAMAYSPDGKTMAVASSGGEVKLVSVASPNSPGVTLKLPDNLRDAAVTPRSNIVFSPDGKRLALGISAAVKNSKNVIHRVLVWDTATNKVIANLEGHTSFINSIAFGPFHGYFFTGSSDGSVIHWGANSDGYELGMHIQSKVDSPVQAIAISHDGNDTAIGYQNGVVGLTGTRTILSSDTSIQERPYSGQKSAVRSLSFTPDDKILAVGREDGTIELWARVRDRLPESILEPSDPAQYLDLTTFKSHTEAVTSLDFSPDGKVLASGSKDNTVRLWDTGPQILKMLPLKGESAVSAVALSADGKTLAVSSLDATVKLCGTDAVRNCKTWRSPTGSVNAMALSPDGQTLAIAGRGYEASLSSRPAPTADSGTVELWNLDLPDAKPVALAGHAGMVYAIAFSRDGSRLVTGSSDGTIRVWDVVSGRQVDMIKLEESISRLLALSPDGSMIAYRVFGGVFVHSLNSDAKPIPIATDIGNAATSAAFSSVDGTRLAIGTQNGTVKLVELAPPGSSTAVSRSERLEGHAGPVNAVAFSPDGKTLATGGDDKTVKLWSVTSYKELITLKGHTQSVTSLVFEPGGKWLASGGYDNAVRFWYAATWEDYLVRPVIRVDQRAF